MRTSRIPVTSGHTAERFGLFAIIESKRVILPLKGVECDFSVLSGIAEVSMTQIFRQDNEKPLDCEYLFPLPADASVYSCEADINGRKIRAQVRERQEARDLAAQKKAAGFRTALVEAERENLFTLSLGNVQPGDLVIIQLEYFQTLRSLAGMPSIEVPFCPGIRYIPGVPLIRSNQGKGVIDDTDEVPDASRITPVRIDADHPDAAYVEVRGTLDAKYVNENELSSPSHPIVVRRTGDELRISLADKGDVPDRDFVLRWREANVDAMASRAWVCEQAKDLYALLEIRAPQEAPKERAPVDFYFLVDRSGSMQGEKWNKAAEALKSCMKVLGPADRAMVTFFESHYRDFAEKPLSAQKVSGYPEFQAVEKLGTAGGTELRPALQHALEVAAKHSAARCKNLILITDAQIGNQPAILEQMKTAPGLPVHCIGIDVALNDSLLLALVRQQGGTFQSLNPNDDIEQAVTSLGKTLGQPVVLNLRFSGPWEAADAVIPNLYAGQIHYLSARSSSPWPLELCGETPSGKQIAIRFDRQDVSSEAPYLHWCRSRIRRLEAEGHEKAAVDLSIKSNLVCPLTAFIAWDESEKVAIANHELVQPVLESCISRSLNVRAKHGGLLNRVFLSAGIDDSIDFLARGDQMLRRMSAEPPQSPVEEAGLRWQLSHLCLSVGISNGRELTKAIMDWIAQATSREREKRIAAVKKLLRKMNVQAGLYAQSEAANDTAAMDRAREKIHQILKDFVRKLPAGK